MFGDFEAQRHWMEITCHLPPTEWYHNSSLNDLQYWGLDYPPLTAYHSWLCGWAAHLINPTWVQLGTSRGYESYNLKLYMRLTVLLSDLCTVIPAVWVFTSYFLKKQSKNKRAYTAVLLLSAPPILLIDYCHFQYNCISLGLTVAAYLAAVVKDYDVISCILFSAAINYKQMELYHAIPFFCFLLKKSYTTRLYRVLLFSFAVIATCIVIWVPYLHSHASFIEVVHRVFPVERGVFEDKVSNVWCALDIIFKIRQHATQDRLIIMCLITTAVFILPSSLHLLLRKSTSTNFLLSLVNSSLAFFLFSYHVHEKSILLVVLPVTLLLPYYPFICNWFIHLATFSLLPLMSEEGNIIPTAAVTVLFYQMSHNILAKNDTIPTWLITIRTISYTTCVIYLFISTTIAPPANKPHLFPVINTLLSSAHFVFFLLIFNYCQIYPENMFSTKLKHSKQE